MYSVTHHKVDLVVKIMHKNAADDICRDIVSSMAQVAEIVLWNVNRSKVEVVVLSTYNSRPAGVPANGTLFLWYKRHGGTRLQGAVNGNGGHD